MLFRVRKSYCYLLVVTYILSKQYRI